MKESVAIAKEADRKKDISSTRSGNSIHRVRNEPERPLGSLRDVIGNIRRDGGTPSVESIATELSVMPYSDRASALLALQQTHGNQYVQRVVTGIQAKLKVGQPGDKYEQEADRVAEEVMRMPEPEVQRQPEEEEKKKEEEELIQIKPISEQITPLVQRQVDAEEEEEEEEILQTKNVSNHTPEVTSDLESRIQVLKGGGQPLSEVDRSFMERRFWVDFSGVSIHTDSNAAQMNKELNAKAFTYGSNIFLDTGRYNPGTSSGKRLLAHELVHVMQQSQYVTFADNPFVTGRGNNTKQSSKKWSNNRLSITGKNDIKNNLMQTSPVLQMYPQGTHLRRPPSATREAIRETMGQREQQPGYAAALEANCPREVVSPMQGVCSYVGSRQSPMGWILCRYRCTSQAYCQGTLYWDIFTQRWRLRNFTCFRVI